VPVIVRKWRACLRSICFLEKAFQKQLVQFHSVLTHYSTKLNMIQYHSHAAKKQWEKCSRTQNACNAGNAIIVESIVYDE